MSSFSVGLWSTVKSYTVPFKEISLCSSFLKPIDMFPKKIIPTYVIICYKFANLFYLHTSNSHHHYNVNLSKIVSLLY